MDFSLRFKLTPAFALLLTFIMSLVVFSLMKLPTYAIGTLPKSLTKSAVMTNQKSWRIIPSLDPGAHNVFQAVAVISATNVWAVGSYASIAANQTLTEHWNGTSWNVVSNPVIEGTNDNHLNAVARIPGTNHLWAVGSSSSNNLQQTLIERWNGKSWSVIPSPNAGSGDNILSAVAALSATKAWAVGVAYSVDKNTSQTLIEYWDGTSWSILPSPNGYLSYSFLTGVTAISATNVWTVGYTSGCCMVMLIEHWDGTSWNIVPSQSVMSERSYFTAVSAVSANDIWAVGSYYDSNSLSNVALTEHWNGTSWSFVPPMNSMGNTSDFNGVTAISATNVWAVGSYYNTSSNQPQTLIEHWNGTNWKQRLSPNREPYPNFLNAVVGVPSRSDVWAVGNYDTNVSDPSTSHTLTEFYS